MIENRDVADEIQSINRHSNRLQGSRVIKKIMNNGKSNNPTESIQRGLTDPYRAALFSIGALLDPYRPSWIFSAVHKQHHQFWSTTALVGVREPNPKVMKFMNSTLKKARNFGLTQATLWPKWNKTDYDKYCRIVEYQFTIIQIKIDTITYQIYIWVLSFVANITCTIIASSLASRT